MFVCMISCVHVHVLCAGDTMDEDDGDYINLLDGNGPEGLYQVTAAR